MKAVCRGVLFLILLTSKLAANPLPVYIEDSHAGTFYWLLKYIDPTQNYTLILFDAHSDATALTNSDYYRKIVHSFRIDKDTDNIIRHWRTNGEIQNYNWIEPLMPSPLRKVLWIPRKHLLAKDKDLKKQETNKQLQANQDVIKRNYADLTDHYIVSDFNTIAHTLDFEDPVIVSIDLDYFNSTSYKKELIAVIEYVVRIKNLKAITIAISTSYLQSNAESNTLLYNLFNCLNNVVECSIDFEPFEDCGIDTSLKAAEYSANNLTIPLFSLDNVSNNVKRMLLNMNNRIKVIKSADKCVSANKRWQNEEIFKPIIQCRDSAMQNIGSYICTTNRNKISIELQAGDEPKNITWNLLLFNNTQYNLCGDPAPFAQGASNIMYLKELNVKKLRGKSTVDLDDLKQYFDKTSGFGTIRLSAEVSYHNDFYRTNTLCISVYKDDSYTGKLTQIFNLPYIYGCKALCVAGEAGPDALCGADCSNFIIYGFRKLGYRLPYCGPLQIRDNFKLLCTVDGIKNRVFTSNGQSVAISEAMIKTGLLLHFGAHVVALYKDNPPINLLNQNDLIVHQLNKYPEIISLSELNRTDNTFLIMTPYSTELKN